MSDTVAIIFDPDFGDALRGLTGCDVWVIRSSTNAAVVDDLRRAGHRHLTAFADYGEPHVEAFDEILRTVELHHGQCSQDPPFQRAAIYGLEFDEAFNDSLGAVGFELEAQTPNGFTAYRAANPPIESVSSRAG